MTHCGWEGNVTDMDFPLCVDSLCDWLPVYFLYVILLLLLLLLLLMMMMLSLGLGGCLHIIQVTWVVRIT